MKRFTFVGCFAAVVAISLAFLNVPSVACTGIRLQSKDGAVIHARTMEFGFPLNSHVTVIPRDYAMSGTTTTGVTGLSWTTKFGAVGMNAFGEGQIIPERGFQFEEIPDFWRFFLMNNALNSES